MTSVHWVRGSVGIHEVWVDRAAWLVVNSHSCCADANSFQVSEVYNAPSGPLVHIYKNYTFYADKQLTSCVVSAQATLAFDAVFRTPLAGR